MIILKNFFELPKITFSKGFNPCFGQKMPIFFVYVDLERIRLKIMLSDFAQEKDTFLTIKDRIFRSPKIRIYPKGLTQAFDQKMSISSLFRSGQSLERSRNNA